MSTDALSVDPQPAPVANKNPPLWPLCTADFRRRARAGGFRQGEDGDAFDDTHYETPEEYAEYLDKDVSEVERLMQERDLFGRQKYGVPLQAANGRDMLVDAVQEALDLTVYLRGLLEETPVGEAGHVSDAFLAVSCAHHESQSLLLRLVRLRRLLRPAAQEATHG